MTDIQSVCRHDSSARSTLTLSAWVGQSPIALMHCSVCGCRAECALPRGVSLLRALSVLQLLSESSVSLAMMPGALSSCLGTGNSSSSQELTSTGAAAQQGDTNGKEDCPVPSPTSTQQIYPGHSTQSSESLAAAMGAAWRTQIRVRDQVLGWVWKDTTHEEYKTAGNANRRMYNQLTGEAIP